MIEKKARVRKVSVRPLDRGFNLDKLKERLVLMPKDDPLWPLLLQLLDAFALVEIEASATPGISSEEAHRFRGRIGMLLDLRRELEQLRSRVMERGE